MLLPLAGVTVHQVVALEDAAQLMLEVTPTVAFPAAEDTDAALVLNVRFEEVPDAQNDFVSVAPN